MNNQEQIKPDDDGHPQGQTDIQAKPPVSRLDAAQKQDPVFVSSLPKWNLLPPMMPIKRVKRNL